MKIAVTGGLACGKTTVCQFLKEMAGYVVDADKIVHELLSSDTAVDQEIGKRIVGMFGSNIIIGNRIDRNKIASLVFSDPKKLKELEQLLHPEVMKQLQKQYERVKNNSSYRFFAAEVPLLYEAQMESYFDYVIAVVASPEIAQKRSSLGREQFAARTRQQEDVSEKAAKADIVITNNGDLQHLKLQVEQVIQQLLKEPK